MSICISTNLDFRMKPFEGYQVAVWSAAGNKEISLDNAFKSNKAFLGLWKSGKYDVVMEITPEIVTFGCESQEVAASIVDLVIKKYEEKWDNIQLCDY